MTEDERIVRGYLQAAHNRGGGWQMAMFMMADDLMRALDGKALVHGAEFTHSGPTARVERSG